MKTCFLILMNDDCHQVFINLERLRVLELNKNRLVEIPGLTFDGLKNVRILKLKRNNLRYVWMVSLCDILEVQGFAIPVTSCHRPTNGETSRFQELYIKESILIHDGYHRYLSGS